MTTSNRVIPLCILQTRASRARGTILRMLAHHTRLEPAPFLMCGDFDYDCTSGPLQFSWRGVAASAIGAGVGQAVGPVFGEAFGNTAAGQFGARLATGLVAGTAAAAMRGGRVAIQQVAIDAFGQSLASSIVGQAGQASQQADMADQANNRTLLNASNQTSDPGYYSPLPQSQGIGPWSNANYVNGMDLDSDRYNGLNARNGSDIESDNYRGGRRVITIEQNKGLLGSMAAQGYSTAQQRALLGQLDRYQQLGGLNPSKLQAGQQFYADLDDLTAADARRGGALISGETAQRMAASSARENASEMQRLASRPVMQGGQGNVPAGATSWASGVDLIPRGGYAAPASLTASSGGVTGYMLDKIDDFQRTSLGQALQGLPPEGFIVGGAKAGLLWAGRVGQAGDVVATEAAALQRMGVNNRAGTYWADLREAYQQSRGQIDFAHIEADVVFKANGQVKAAGGHFYNSPMIDIVQGTETVGSNRVVRAQVNLLGADGNWYLKTNSKDGISSLTPSNWSMAQAKGEMSQAWMNRVFDPQLGWRGTSGGVTFQLNPPPVNHPTIKQWRGYPLQSP